MTYKEKFQKEFKDLKEIDLILNTFKESDFKRYYDNLAEWEEVYRLNLNLPLKPIKKSRPRASGNRVYDPDDSIKKSYINYIDRLYGNTKELKEIRELVTEDTIVHSNIRYYDSGPTNDANFRKLLKVTGNSNKTLNADIDNYEKFILDVLVKSEILYDDSTITYSEARKDFSFMPRIEIELIYYERKE